MEALSRAVGWAMALAAVASSVPAATVTPAQVSARGRTAARVKVESFGRVALVAASQEGVALRLHDRMVGVVGEAGVAGERDGRLDVFLEPGDYQLEVEGTAASRGQASLRAVSFAELNPSPAPQLPDQRRVEATLEDFQQRSYWLLVEREEPVPLQVAGRALAQVRLWRNGVAGVGEKFESGEVDWGEGRPVRVLRGAPRLAPGWYLLTAYGGPPLTWSGSSQEFPLILQRGVPLLPTVVRQRFELGPFGCDVLRLPAEAATFRLELPEPRRALLEVGEAVGGNVFTPAQETASLDKDSRVPVVELAYRHVPPRGGRTAPTGVWSGQQGPMVAVRVCGAPGQPYLLQMLPIGDTTRFWGGGREWLSVVTAGDPRDLADTTAILVNLTSGSLEAEAVIALSRGASYKRRFNLVSPTKLYVRTRENLALSVKVAGVAGTASLAPAPAELAPQGLRVFSQSWPATFSLPAGLWELNLVPAAGGVGEMTLEALSAGAQLLEMTGLRGVLARLGVGGEVPSALPRPWVRLGPLDLSPADEYRLFVGQASDVRVGVLRRTVPLEVREPLPLALEAGEEVALDVAVTQASVLRALGEDGREFPLSVNGGPAERGVRVAPDLYRVAIRNHLAVPAFVTLVGYAESRLPQAPLPQVPAAVLAGLTPPPLQVDRPVLMALSPEVRAVRALEIPAAGLYRVESLGIWRTSATLSTRVGELASGEANGTGENFLIQEYLRPGYYELAMTAAQSWESVPVRLSRASIRDEGTLPLGGSARIALAAGEAAQLRLDVATLGRYRVRAQGLRRLARCRLEDADGYPVALPGGPCLVEAQLQPGVYRLLLLPGELPSRVMATFSAEEKAAPLVGRGPHPLRVGRRLEHLWLEPPPGVEEPDVYVFSLPAQASARLTLSPGMAGELRRELGEGRWEWFAAVDGGRPFEGELAAGNWQLAVRAGRGDNRFPYSVELEVDELLAGEQREVVAPVELPVAVGGGGLMELFSGGGEDVRAELYDDRGKLVAAGDDEAGSWNFRLSVSLPAGRYRLKVLPVGSARAATVVFSRQRAEVAAPSLSLPGRWEAELREEVLMVPLVLPGRVPLLGVWAAAGEPVGLEVRTTDGAVLAQTTGKPARVWVSPPAGTSLQVRLWGLEGRAGRVEVAGWAGEVPAVAAGALQAVAGTGRWVGRVPLTGGGVVALSGEEVEWAALGGGALSPAGGRAVATAAAELVVVAASPTLGVRRLELAAGEKLKLRLAGGAPVPLRLATSGPAVVLAEGFPEAAAVSAGAAPRRGAFLVQERRGVAWVEEGTNQVWVWPARGEDATEVELSLFPLAPPASTGLTGGTVYQVLAAGQGIRVPLAGRVKEVRLALSPYQVAVPLAGARPVGVSAAGEAPAAETLITEADALGVWSLQQPGAVAATVLESSLPAPLGEGWWCWQPTGSGVLRLPLAPAPAGWRVRVWGARGDGEVLSVPGEPWRGAEGAVAMGGGWLTLPHGRERVCAWVTAPDAARPLPAAVEKWEAVNLPARVKASGGRTGVTFDVATAQAVHVFSGQAITLTLEGPGERREGVLPGPGRWTAPVPPGEVRLRVRCLEGSDCEAQVLAAPVTTLSEGQNPERLLSPGERAHFRLSLAAERRIGLGVRLRPDAGEVRLLARDGQVVGEGPVVLQTLPAGEYLLEVGAPEEGEPVTAQVIAIGLEGAPRRPPEDLLACYRLLDQGLVGQCPPPAVTAREQPLPWEDEEEYGWEEEEPPETWGADGDDGEGEVEP